MIKRKIVKREFCKNHDVYYFSNFKFTNATVIAEFNVDLEENINVIHFFDSLIPLSQQIYDCSKSKAEKFIGYWLYNENDESLHAIYKEVK